MTSRQDATLPAFQNSLWDCSTPEQLHTLATRYPNEPLFVDKGYAEWFMSRRNVTKASEHALKPLALNISEDNPFFHDVLDANAIGQCIYILFITTYQGQSFRSTHSSEQGLSFWGKLFCLGYCYLSQSMLMLAQDPSRHMFEQAEARAFLTMKFLGTKYDATMPCAAVNDMVAHDYLLTGAAYAQAGYPDDRDTWTKRALDFVNGNPPNPIFPTTEDELPSASHRGGSQINEFLTTINGAFLSGDLKYSQEQLISASL